MYPRGLCTCECRSRTGQEEEWYFQGYQGGTEKGYGWGESHDCHMHSLRESRDCCMCVENVSSFRLGMIQAQSSHASGGVPRLTRLSVVYQCRTPR